MANTKLGWMGNFINGINPTIAHNVMIGALPPQSHNETLNSASRLEAFV